MSNLDRIYLDYASTTPVDPEVLRAMEPYFSMHFGNPGSVHSFGQKAIAAVDASRESIAKSIDANFREIVFMGSATEANNLVLRGVLRLLNNELGIRNYGEKNSLIHNSKFIIPRIIVSSIEHESILETARDLEREGVEVIYLPVSREGFVDLKAFKKALNERTILVLIMYANNEVGTVQSISEISKIVRDFRNVGNVGDVGNEQAKRSDKRALASDQTFRTNRTYPLFHTDAVQAFQYLDCDVNKLGVDFMTLSAHKIYGPKGIGCLYVRNVGNVGNVGNVHKRALASDQTFRTLSPIITGGGQEFGLRSATENVPAIVGFGKAVEMAEKLRDRESLRVRKLRDYSLDGLKKICPKLKVNGSLKYRLPNNLNVSFVGHKSSELLVKLDLAGIAVSAGSACGARTLQPSHVLNAIGLSSEDAVSALRFTLGRGTTKREIDRVLGVLKDIL